MDILLYLLIGAAAWFFVRVLLGGFFVVNQNERAVKTVFGRAKRINDAEADASHMLRDDEKER